MAAAQRRRYGSTEPQTPDLVQVGGASGGLWWNLEKHAATERKTRLNRSAPLDQCVVKMEDKRGLKQVKHL